LTYTNKVDTRASCLLWPPGARVGLPTVDASNMVAGVVALGAQAKLDVNAEADTALTDYDPPTNTEMEARTLAAANYGTAANQTTILNRLGAWTGTGVNTLLGAFKALLSKAAALPSDITGTGDPATDSVEALAEAIAAIPTNPYTGTPPSTSDIVRIPLKPNRYD